MYASNYDAVISPPFGVAKLGIRTDQTSVSCIDFIVPNVVEYLPETGFVLQVVTQLQNYFKDPDWKFTLSVAPHGSQFQQQVWTFLTDIPSGSTYRYGDLARRLATSPRSIGGACRANPIPIIIPCHRIVAVSGIGGYAGKTQGGKLAIKRWLLTHEQQKTN